MLVYKGYAGKVEFDDKDKILYGEVVNTKDVITFQSERADKIEEEFKKSVDIYIDWCKENNRPPEKPYSGKFVVRISPELHQKLAVISSSNKVSINKYVNDMIRHSL